MALFPLVRGGDTGMACRAKQLLKLLPLVSKCLQKESKILSDNVFVVIEYFIMNKEFTRFDWLILCSLTSEFGTFSERKL